MAKTRQRGGGQQERRARLRQMDLFTSGQEGSATGAPAWPDLPTEARAVLTSLMARLFLEHADRSQTASLTEAGHDH